MYEACLKSTDTSRVGR